MDPIIQKLNQQVTEKIGGGIITPEGEASPFQQSLDKSEASRLMDKMKTSFDGQPQEISALSAENIHVNTVRPEMEAQEFNSKDRFNDIFSKLNRDLNSLDATIEVLNTPGNGNKLNASQLLALQAGMADITITAEGFSRFADAMSRGIQTVLNTQV